MPTHWRPPSIALSAAERDALLRTRFVCRIAFLSRRGPARIASLPFVWDGTALWAPSPARRVGRCSTGSPGWTSAIVEDGAIGATALRGVQLSGYAEAVEGSGDGLGFPELLFAGKYREQTICHGSRHGWLRLAPDLVASWDLARIAQPGIDDAASPVKISKS